ncbi:hypothetical protein COV20_01615 [Candidatus Woesearchaeota archaeon CG10_big_fil_rev_8_21_14_0_10_45_16]|nr:MAG: hypothetical protein COV20_01615 [Candidatus Woesearchaeota archaeon CG10_big_fil_rev_8_21_14_0_10_45_16]
MKKYYLLLVLCLFLVSCAEKIEPTVSVETIAPISNFDTLNLQALEGQEVFIFGNASPYYINIREADSPFYMFSDQEGMKVPVLPYRKLQEDRDYTISGIVMKGTKTACRIESGYCYFYYVKEMVPK